jgi:hypothetical protein
MCCGVGLWAGRRTGRDGRRHRQGSRS